MSKKLASEVVRVAKSFIGCKESDGSHKKIIDTYNSQKTLPRNYRMTYKDAWCATFVSAVSVILGYTDIIPTECSCGKMIELFKQKNRWIENENRTPAPGEIIFYDWQDSGSGDNTGWSDHVGIVEKVSSGKITVIEGNYSDSVKRRTIAVNGKYIRGFGVPNYDSEPIYFPKYSGKSVSIVDGLSSIGAASSFNYRKKIAAANNIQNYEGTAKQNTTMLVLLKSGQLIKP